MITIPAYTLAAILTESEWAFVKPAFKSNGELRASRPDTSLNNGKTAFFWRNLVFIVSSQRAHQCMPTTDWFYLEPEENKARNARKAIIEKECFKNKTSVFGNAEYTALIHDSHRAVDALAKDIMTTVDKVLAIIPKSEQAGLTRWAKAFGL